MRETIIIEESGRCSWGKCIFCSFSKKENLPEPDVARLKERLEKRLLDKPEVLKYFNSGSFLDEKQIHTEFRNYLVRRCKEAGVKELILECRPEYITEKSLGELLGLSPQPMKITFALGLESADDEILTKVCKGFQVKDYIRSADLLEKNGFGVRTYVMANLPFVKDIAGSLKGAVGLALEHGKSVAIINTFARAPAPLFEMWLAGTWAPLDKSEFERLTKPYEKNKKIEIYFGDYVDYPHFSKKESLVGANENNLTHPHYVVWQDYISRFYEKPEAKKYALFLPCSFRKPYSESKTHREIIRHLLALEGYESIHQIMISNPGVIPREYEAKYPFANYDWPEWEETKEIKKRYIEVTKKRIKNYLATHKYEKVFAYFRPEAESLEALRRAARELGVKVAYCVDKKEYDQVKDNDCALADRRLLGGLARVLRENLEK